jgi:hypothetical protein
MRTATLGIVFAVIAACVLFACGSPERSAAVGIVIERDDSSNFVAEYRTVNGPDVRVVVRYAASTTFFEVATSAGITLVSDGTERRPMPARLHPRGEAGQLIIGPADPEYAALNGLHAALLQRGISRSPALAERGSPAYAAGYWTARLLGMLEFSPTSSGAEEVWPYPGAAAPSQVCVSNPALPRCCGPCDCANGIDQNLPSCAPNDVNSATDWWCAAGDHCNKYHLWTSYPGGNCGTAYMCNDPNETDALCILSGYYQPRSFHHDSTIIHFAGCNCGRGQLCCDYGAKTGAENYCNNPYGSTQRWFAAGVPAGPPTAACGAGDQNGADNGTCGTDQRDYYCYQGKWHLKDDCLSRGQDCVFNRLGADYCGPTLRPPQSPCGAGDWAGPNNGTCGSDDRDYFCYQGVWRVKDDCPKTGRHCRYNPSGADYCQ